MANFTLAHDPKHTKLSVRQAFDELANQAAQPSANFKILSTLHTIGLAFIETDITDVKQVEQTFPAWRVKPEGKFRAI